MITISISDGAANSSAVRTSTTDDYHYMKDSLHAALEQPGEFGSKFPVFMKRFEDDEWEVVELPDLERELESLIATLKGMEPRPLDSNWQSKMFLADPPPTNLYEVFLDAEGNPLLGSLLELCRVAQEEGKAVSIR